MRTEQEILKDFEKLGWNVASGYIDFTFKKIEKEQEMFGDIYHHCYININKEKQNYSAIDLHSFNTFRYELSMQEHKLLHELFICYGWIGD